MLARESAAMLGHWQQRVGVGMSLRQATDALACTARSRPGVKVGGGAVVLALHGSCHGWCRAKFKEAVVHALLAMLGLLSLAMVGC